MKKILMATIVSYPFVVTIVLSADPKPEYGVIPLTAIGVALFFLCPILR